MPAKTFSLGLAHMGRECILSLPRTPEKGERQEFGAGIMDCVTGDNFRAPVVKLLFK